jgi:uncharacterized protein (DUF2267 family)
MSHDSESFISLVQRKAGLSREDAERATRATLQTLGDRLARGEAQDLADELPDDLAPLVATATADAQPFDVDEFFRRVAAAEGIDDLEAAERHARAVFDALGRVLSDREVADMIAQLPRDYRPLIDEATGFASVEPAEVLLGRIADRAGIDREAARRAADAVLRTLGERIAGGEVEDLVTRLPVELHPPLRAGNEASRGKAQRMSVEEFVDRIAEREGVTPLEAAEHARAVFATLREAVGEEEFRDVTDQLPHDFAALAAR